MLTVDLYGTYEFEWVETNGTCTERDTVIIDFNETPDGLSAGADQQLCDTLATTLTGTEHTYQAGSEHNGSAKQWYYVSGPDNTPTFSTITSAASDVTVDLYGTYEFEWVETNGTCTERDTVIIDFNETPDGLSAGADQQLCDTLATTLTGTEHTYQGGSEHNGSAKQWYYVSGPDNTPTFSSISSADKRC